MFHPFSSINAFGIAAWDFLKGQARAVHEANIAAGPCHINFIFGGVAQKDQEQTHLIIPENGAVFGYGIFDIVSPEKK